MEKIHLARKKAKLGLETQWNIKILISWVPFNSNYEFEQSIMKV